MLDINQTLHQLTQVFQTNNNILLAYLFGSYNDGFAHKNSDIDLAVLLNRDISLWDEMALQASISEAVKFDKVDLINLNKAPIRMQFKIMSTGRLIYEVDYNTTSDYIEKVLNLYHDREPRYRMFFKEYDASLREDYSNG